MNDFLLFIVVGGVAVAAAVMMLLSRNAVHSALFLVTTMACLAFLFLMLNAPFLAMIQITVYAGAIMVLFIFVIMLLGAEQLEPGSIPGDNEGRRRFPWYIGAAVVLAMSLLIVAALTILQGQVNQQAIPQGAPMLRVINAAADAQALDLYANDQLVASGLPFGQTSEFIPLPEGDVNLRVGAGDLASVTETVSTNALAAGQVYTLVAYGEGLQPQIAVLPTNLETVADGTSRLTLFNGTGTPVNLVDFGSAFVEDDTTVLKTDIAPGTLSEPVIQEDGTVDWAIVDTAAPETVVFPLSEYEIERDTSKIMVLAQERVPDNSGLYRPTIVSVVTEAEPSFGGPRQIGYALFVDYLLPFQLLAMLLLAAMVGAIVLTHRELGPTRKQTGRRKVSRPLTSVLAAQVGHDVTEPGTTSSLPAPNKAEEPEAVGK